MGIIRGSDHAEEGFAFEDPLSLQAELDGFGVEGGRCLDHCLVFVVGLKA